MEVYRNQSLLTKIICVICLKNGFVESVISTLLLSSMETF